MQMRARSIGFLLLLIAGWGSHAGAQVVKRQPYLQVVTPTSVVVRWDTDSSMTGMVHYGASSDFLPNSASEATARTKHQVTLTGLLPAQKYYYSVSGPSGGDSSQYVITAPPPGSAPVTRIWVISDFGQSNAASDNTRRLQTIDVWKKFNNNDLRADIALSLGDQSEEDTDAQLQANYFDQLQDVLKITPLYTIAGNHEDTDGEVSYKAAFTLPANGEAGGYPSGTDDYYSITWGNIHIVALTVENDVDIDGAQATWLQNDLAQNTSDWLIAIMHRPMHSAGYHPTDASSTALKQKQTWLPLLEAAGVDLILAGHNHVYERSYLVDNLIGLSTDITDANMLDTTLGRVDMAGAYRKIKGKPHDGTIFLNCAAGGTSNKASYLTHPFSFTPVVFPGDTYEGSQVIDVRGRDRLDVYFLCDVVNVTRWSNIWDWFTIEKMDASNAVGYHPLGIPETFSVRNYPNPFNPSTIIEYTVGGGREPGAGTRVKLAIYDLLGREVTILVNERKVPGSYRVSFDGSGLASGFYVCCLEYGVSFA
jgi:predicted phosphodiesterase